MKLAGELTINLLAGPVGIAPVCHNRSQSFLLFFPHSSVYITAGISFNKNFLRKINELTSLLTSTGSCLCANALLWNGFCSNRPSSVAQLMSYNSLHLGHSGSLSLYRSALSGQLAKVQFSLARTCIPAKFSVVYESFL